MSDGIIFPKGTIVTIDSVAAQDRHRGGLFVYGNPDANILVRKRQKNGRQTRRVGNHYERYWTVSGTDDVVLFLGDYRGRYKPGTPIVTEFDPTRKRRQS